VPPEIRVEVEGHPLLGVFEVERKAPSTTSPDAPLLRVTGTALMGAVTIHVVDPNAPGWLEKIGARLAAKRG
jgi:hypothetical protein